MRALNFIENFIETTFVLLPKGPGNGAGLRTYFIEAARRADRGSVRSIARAEFRRLIGETAELHAAASKPTPWRAGGGRHTGSCHEPYQARPLNLATLKHIVARGHFVPRPLDAQPGYDGCGRQAERCGHFIADVVSELYAERLLCRTAFPHSGTQFFPWLHGADSLPAASRFVASCLQTGNRLQTSADLY